MNFKSSEQLISRVNKTLNTFKSSGLLDEGDFYRWIKEVLTLLNIPSFTPVHAIVPVEGNKLRVPDDMYQLWSVWRYEEEKKGDPTPIRHYQRQARYYVQEDTLQSQCEDNCTTITHDKEMMISKFYIEETPVTTVYKSRQPVKIVNYAVNKCSADSPSLNISSSLQANIDNNYFYFNFSDGSVYLQYYKLQLDFNGLPMIPDVSEIELAIEAYIIYRFFQELYYNGTTDALQRMQYAKNEYTTLFDKAKTWVKTPTARALYNIAMKTRGRFNMYELKHSRE